jgi:hypothetical protein
MYVILRKDADVPCPQKFFLYDSNFDTALKEFNAHCKKGYHQVTWAHLINVETGEIITSYVYSSPLMEIIQKSLKQLTGFAFPSATDEQLHEIATKFEHENFKTGEWVRYMAQAEISKRKGNKE